MNGCREAATGLARALESLREGERSPLEELHLSNTWTTEGQLRTILSRCPNLKILNLGICPGSGEGLARALADLPETLLEELNLHYTMTTTADQVRTIVSHCSHLKTLNLDGCPGSADGLVEALRDLPEEHRPPLEKLFLYRTDVTEEHIDALRELLQNCKIFYFIRTLPL